MNKKYITDLDGIVTIISDAGDISKRDDKYTKNTDEILALENLVESLDKKITNLDNFKNESENELKETKKSMLVIPLIGYTIIGISFLVTGLLDVFIPMLIGWTIGTVLMETCWTISLKLTHKEIKNLNHKIKVEKHRINKIKKRIETLSKDKTQIEIKYPNQYQNVKNIYNYNFDPSDYFIENYMIDKRTKEMNKSKKKVRKLTKEDNIELLKYKK